MDTISQGPSHHFFGVENVLVTYYVATPPAEALRERESWVIATLETYETIGLLVVVDVRASGAMPDQEFREVSRQQAEKYRTRIACSAVVLESDTIWFGLLRSFLRGLSLVVRAPFPVRYFSDVTDAAPFVFESCGAHAGTVVAAVESARFIEVADPQGGPELQSPYDASPR